jgi:hypothetical protein
LSFGTRGTESEAMAPPPDQCSVEVFCTHSQEWISCIGSVCISKEADCPYERGLVRCDDLIIECPPCCNYRDIEYVTDGTCCDPPTRALVYVWTCIGGEMKYSGTDCILQTCW